MLAIQKQVVTAWNEFNLFTHASSRFVGLQMRAFLDSV